MEAQQYQELLRLLQRLLEDQIAARDKATQETIATKVEVQVLREKLEHLREQLHRADATIAAKEETINLLRASYNRPN